MVIDFQLKFDSGSRLGFCGVEFRTLAFIPQNDRLFTPESDVESVEWDPAVYQWDVEGVKTLPCSGENWRSVKMQL
jgi:hypothetical protein